MAQSDDEAWSELRASDADREKVAAQLRHHFEVGRLTMEEMDDRLDQAYGARTLGQLYSLTNDLPHVSGAHPVLEGRTQGSSHPVVPGSNRPARRHPWPVMVSVLSYLIISAVAVVAWAVSGGGGGGHFWPAWVFLGAAIVFAKKVSRQIGQS